MDSSCLLVGLTVAGGFQDDFDMITTAQFRRYLVAVAASLAVAASVMAHEIGKETGNAKQSGPPAQAAGERNAELMAPALPAVERGLKYLASRQQEDGAFATSGYGRNAAVVALAGMAWLAGGSTPGAGRMARKLAESPITCWSIVMRAGSSASKGR